MHRDAWLSRLSTALCLMIDDSHVIDKWMFDASLRLTKMQRYLQSNTIQRMIKILDIQVVPSHPCLLRIHLPCIDLVMIVLVVGKEQGKQIHCGLTHRHQLRSRKMQVLWATGDDSRHAIPNNKLKASMLAISIPCCMLGMRSTVIGATRSRARFEAKIVRLWLQK